MSACSSVHAQPVADQQIFTIALKDLRSELRTKEAMNAALAFALVMLLIFNFAFDPELGYHAADFAGGLFWIVFAFAGVLILNRSFARESQRLPDALIAAPVPGGAVPRQDYRGISCWSSASS